MTGDYHEGVVNHCDYLNPVAQEDKICVKKGKKKTECEASG